MRITDNGSPPLSETLSFSVIVVESNRRPIWEPIGDKTIVEGELLVITGFASDPDLPPNLVTYSLDTNAPAGASINPTNGLFTWTPAENQGPGTNLINLIATDNGFLPLSATQTFTVIVLESNQSPVLAPVANLAIVEGEALTFTNSATDPDWPQQLLTFSLDINAPAGAVINSTNGILESDVYFRLNCRIDGQPALASAITPRVGRATLSPFVSLDTRS